MTIDRNRTHLYLFLVHYLRILRSFMTKFLHIDSLWLFRHSVVMVIESELYKTCCRAKKKLNS